ncbi:hypothetical protein BX286_0826 [Streptomyces sp. 3211.6]|uniref:hypothetical protein n=1 Tax=Streptomyces sp. 3211.6 TaxID=1938845 RepID=UPI000EAE3547|nr:hypothetical protein [Streptomyces sp. 3211.6]RKT02913.1 hypothetical protein BX286_0826 [Streptomyces sp. 3211.6]
MTVPYRVRALARTDYPQAGSLLSRRWAREAECGRPLDQKRDFALIQPLRTGDHNDELHGLFEDGQLVAMWELDPTGPGPGWSTSERAENSVGLLLLYTDPVHRNAGRLVSLWLADQLARHPRPPEWLRYSVTDDRLADHITRAWGWKKVRYDNRRHFLQLPCEVKPALRVLITGPVSEQAPSCPSPAPPARSEHP